MAPMYGVILAVVWHFWLAVALAFPAVLLIVATIVGYVTQVTRTRYPKQ